ncbi:serine hydrolase domain-containing protein [Algoriphagus vanfongensis]|uniref:serine hydrolase domain-containing protein n=1 Tax=Algoriphagus vanfongensis TaxID=426371 RepID=UPI000412ECA8|nr:serine hydrolase domain-containing protein [Algoriphagus vanfongensis]
MKSKVKFILWGIVGWLVIFLGIEWWNSYPRITLAPPMGSTSLKEKLDSSLIASFNENFLAGISISIIRDSKVYHRKSLGFLDHDTHDSLNWNSTLPVASVSKLFTSLTLARYLDRLDITLEDSLHILKLPELDRETALGKLTFEELLRHQSGISDPGKLNSLLSFQNNLSLETFGKELTQKFASESQIKEYQYADSNFDLVGYLLQSYSGMDFTALSDSLTLERLGMGNSYFSFDHHLPNGHKKTRVWKRIKPAPMTLALTPSPSSGLISSVEDLEKSLIQMIRGDLGLLQSELNWLQSDPDLPPAGFQAISLHDHTYFGHYGAQAGFSSLLVFDPTSKTGLILLANSKDDQDFRKKIASQLLALMREEDTL